MTQSTLLYSFSSPISELVNDHVDHQGIVINQTFQTLCIVSIVLVLVGYLAARLVHHFFGDYSKQTKTHRVLYLPVICLSLVMFLPTVKDVRSDAQDKIITENAAVIDRKVAYWMRNNNIPQYVLCNDKAIYSTGEGMQFAEYRTSDTLLCGGINEVHDFKVSGKVISIIIEDDGVYGVIK